MLWEFTCGTEGYRVSIVTATVEVVAMAQVQFLAWEFPHTVGTVKKKKKKNALVIISKMYVNNANRKTETS